MRTLFWLVVGLIVLTPALAQQADWVGPVTSKDTWDYKSKGYCPRTDRCFMGRLGCLNSTQYVLDNYCENGSWSTRTKLVAQQLLALALSESPTNYALYCNSYDAALNEYAYNTAYGSVTSFLSKFCTIGNRVENCANNVCVLKYGSDVAFGMAINTDISGTKSPLQALNISKTACDNEKNTDGDYDSCGSNAWYNHNTQSIIYAKESSLPTITTTTQNTLLDPYNKLNNYVFTYVHNPDVPQYNYTSYNITPKFDQVYIAKDGTDFLFSFRHGNITKAQKDYAGWYFANIDLPGDACDRIIKRYDDRANCEQQPSETEFYITALKTPPVGRFDISKSIADAWKEMTGKVRVSP